MSSSTMSFLTSPFRIHTPKPSDDENQVGNYLQAATTKNTAINLKSTNHPSEPVIVTSVNYESDIADYSRIAPCWKDLESETGFNSYKDYLDHHLERWPQHEYLAEQLTNEDSRARYTHSGRYYMFDYHNNGFTKPLEFEGLFKENGCTKLLQSLRTISDEVITRFLFVETGRCQELPPRLVDAVGLSMRIDPRVFEAFSLRKCVDELSPAFGEAARDTLRDWIITNPRILNRISEPRPLQPTYIAIGPYVATIGKLKNNIPCVVVLSYA